MLNGITTEQFVGYINKVRIWNVARTQNQIMAFMNTSLPNPSAQTGLLAYYSFDNLLNKQGNPAWNGTLGGTATINQLNPSCATFVADSCETVNSQEYIINAYTEVLGSNVCNNSLTVADASNYKVGDTVLLIQMKGASIDSSNPSQCWDGTYKGQPQKADVYVYIVKAKTFCESAVFRRGTFALIR
ncbi:MAG TPA: hypothetical protein VFS36_16165 [Chitinophagaceae bacterium]|jgi:hypothetical protein|nr:hypothetical protein [Chitinophagaceae bacterium]